MFQFHLDLRIFGAQVLGGPLGEIDRAVLAARAAEIDRQMRELPFQIVVHGHIHYCKHVVLKCFHFFVLFQITDNAFVSASESGIFFFPARVGQGATIEDETAAVAGIVRWNPFLI